MSVKLTQPVICASRSDTAPVAAISPAVTNPSDQYHSAPPTSSTGRTPAIAISQNRKDTLTRPKSRLVSRNLRIAPKAARSSWSAWANSFTVLILVIVSTTCPVTIARAPARAFENLRTRGMKWRIKKTYPTIHNTKPAAIRQSTVPKSITAPIKDAAANSTVCSTSVTTSVSARLVCISFWEIRPAKSLSKNVTACPSV